jgi:NADP-dependent 3-hydroxy acid dehydrogenase YdfG
MKDQRRIAIIIGGSGSLGQAIANYFASKTYDILITGRDTDKLKSVSANIQSRFSDVSIDALYLDFNDPSSYQPFLSYIVKEKNRLSILINSAAGFYKGNFSDMTSIQIQSLICSNFTGIVTIINEFIKIVKDLSKVDLINITSYSSATNLDISKSSSLHIATKAALQTFDTVLGNELVNTNIRLTTIAPSTLAKNGRVGLPMDDIAELIWLVHIIPDSIKIDTVVLNYTGK